MTYFKLPMIHFKLDKDYLNDGNVFKEQKFTSKNLRLYLSFYKDNIERYIKDSRANKVKARKLMSMKIYSIKYPDMEIALDIYKNLNDDDNVIVVREVSINWETPPEFNTTSEYLCKNIIKSYKSVINMILDLELPKIVKELPNLIK